MKTVKIVRVENQKEKLRYFQVYPNCTQNYFCEVVNEVLGNPLTQFQTPVFIDSNGTEVQYKDFQNDQTYFLTFDKQSKFFNCDPVTLCAPKSAKILDVLTPEEYTFDKIKKFKTQVKEKLAYLADKLDSNRLILKNGVHATRSLLGCQSLELFEFGKDIGVILDKISFLSPKLSSLISKLDQTSADLIHAYSETPLAKPKNIPKVPQKPPNKQLVKDIPVNELTATEYKRFVRFIEKHKQPLQESKDSVPLTPSQSTIRPEEEKVLIHREGRIKLGYFKVYKNEMFISRNISFKEYEVINLGLALEIKKATAVSDTAIEINLHTEKVFLEFEEPLAFAYWLKRLAKEY